MTRRRIVSLTLATLVWPLAAVGADLTGALLYDDLPVATVFPDIISATAYANPWEPGDQVDGTVDLASSTYSISGLEAGLYGISVYLDRTGSPGDVGDAGDLQAYVNFEVTDAGGSFQQDLDVRYNYHVVSPIDSDLPLDGKGLDCTAHPTVEYPITFAIEAVPRAVEYLFNVDLRPCPGASVGWLELPSPDPFVVIDWGTADEDFQSPWARCFGASGRDLCGGPTFEYTDAHVWGLFLRDGGASGRGTHHADAVVIPAVAATPGSQGTYWTSAVTIANLADTDREVEILYTPRGRDGSLDYDTTTVTIAASSQLGWSDVVGDLFAATGAGAIEIRGHQLAVTSRTSTPDDEDGSYGQGIPPLQPNQLLFAGGTDTAIMGGVEHGTVFRTNLGLCEVWGDSATVRVAILDGDMAELGFRNVELRPYENTQINDVVEELTSAGGLENGLAMVTVTAGTGRVGAYLSVVDNATGDPTFIAIAPQSPAGS